MTDVSKTTRHVEQGRAAAEEILDREVRTSFQRWLRQVRAVLPSDAYPHTPQLVGSAHQRRSKAID